MPVKLLISKNSRQKNNGAVELRQPKNNRAARKKGCPVVLLTV